MRHAFSLISPLDSAVLAFFQTVFDFLSNILKISTQVTLLTVLGGCKDIIKVIKQVGATVRGNSWHFGLFDVIIFLIYSPFNLESDMQARNELTTTKISLRP